VPQRKQFGCSPTDPATGSAAPARSDLAAIGPGCSLALLIVKVAAKRYGRSTGHRQIRTSGSRIGVRMAARRLSRMGAAEGATVPVKPATLAAIFARAVTVERLRSAATLGTVTWAPCPDLDPRRADAKCGHCQRESPCPT
jgi:hypothetical protein